MIKVKRITGVIITDFRLRYESLSGLSIPLEYLARHKVYGYFYRSKLIGGFILADSIPLRTIEVFSSPSSKNTLYSSIMRFGKITEICCFWLDHKYRKIKIVNALCWIFLSVLAFMQFGSKLLIFGTNSTGLARLYGYPKNSLLLHRDRIGQKDTFIFIAKRTDILSGIWSIVWARATRTKKAKGIIHELNALP